MLPIGLVSLVLCKSHEKYIKKILDFLTKEKSLCMETEMC